MLLDFFVIFFIANFAVAVLGFLSVRFNILLWLISIEMLLFSSNMVFLFTSIFYDDLMGQIYALILLLIIAGESAFAFILLVSIINLEKPSNFNYVLNKKL